MIFHLFENKRNTTLCSMLVGVPLGKRSWFYPVSNILTPKTDTGPARRSTKEMNNCIAVAQVIHIWQISVCSLGRFMSVAPLISRFLLHPTGCEEKSLVPR
ncbi:hypothetical protein H105_07462 [Trichophyton soudanense CBS 452.61]|uniref:Uncharacterized protein n=1 Tax=Trichophyton soudanense CBS 452.61 TaxID=1215331 RepID=A0A022XI77_TRISD|nr:hypothetical protein H105_07462 [Trichophyton soudanense CBS 452.61]EZG02426.1 hypothetical protein H106_07287 [Trichophyton rubrum CBS 735.88]